MTTRREFLSVTGATAAAALAVERGADVFWTTVQPAERGWAPGIESWPTSACLICPGRCGIRGRVVDGRLVRVVGNPLHPMSRGGVCPRGVAGVQLLYHPERYMTPLVRVGPRGAGQWRAVSAEGAVALVAERLSELRTAGRPDALALLAGHCPGSMGELWRQFLEAFGSPNYVPDDYDDGTAAVMDLMHGIGRRPAYDLDRTGLVLSFGAPLFEAWWSPLQAYAAFGGPEGNDSPRPRFIQVDTRFSRTAARCHEWVGVRPGTHAALALGMAYVLIRDELLDAGFVRDHVEGFEDSRDRPGYQSLVMRHYRTEEVSAVTGVPVERITALARSFAQSPSAVAVVGADVTHAPNGLAAALAVHSLNVLTGNVNRVGGVLFGDDPLVAALPRVALDQHARASLGRAPVAGADAPFGSGGQALRFTEAVGAAEEGLVDTLLVYYADPLASSSHEAKWREALEKIPFVVSFTPFLDATVRYADLVLPDLLPYERWQDAPTPASYPYPVWGLARPLVEPRSGGMATGEVVLALARHLGGTVAEALPFASFVDLLRERARGLFRARRGMTLGDDFERRHHQQMEARGWWLPEHTEFEPFWEALAARGGWTDLYYDETDPDRRARTPSGRIDLMPPALLAALDARGRPALYREMVHGLATAPDEFPLRLLPYRVSTLASGTLPLQSWLAERPGLFPEVHWHPWVEVHPRTARRLGFDDGAAVWVVSARGRYRARLKVFPGTAPENVCAPYGLRHPDGELANPLRLLDGSRDVLTGLPSWITTFVRLERA